MRHHESAVVATAALRVRQFQALGGDADVHIYVAVHRLVEKPAQLCPAQRDGKGHSLY